MVNSGHWGRTLILLVWSLLLTGLTGILAIGPLRVLRSQLGTLVYTLTVSGLVALLFGLKLPVMALAFSLMSIMALVMIEAEDVGFKRESSAALGVFSGALMAVAGFAYWARLTGPGWIQVITEKVNVQLQKVAQVSFAGTNQLTLTADDLVMQMPSILIIALIVAAAVGLIVEKPIYRWMKLASPAARWKMTEFKLPDVTVWVVIGALLLAFVDLGQGPWKSLGTNLLNISIVLFFFQGLAVLCKYFEVFRVGQVWRALWIVLFVSQLFLVLSFVGFVDYWVDFRSLFVRKAGELMKRSKQ